MTFRAERYPADWHALSLAIRERAGQTCECTGQCGDDHDGGRCEAPNGEPILRYSVDPWRWVLASEATWEIAALCRSPATYVVLTVAHLDHDEGNSAPSNLLGCCQRCHLRIDSVDNARRRRENRDRRTGQGTLL